MGERTYTERRAQLREVLGALTDLDDEREHPEETNVARVLHEELVGDRFKLAVFGEFKSIVTAVTRERGTRLGICSTASSSSTPPVSCRRRPSASSISTISAASGRISTGS
jgi:hypothetical protein